MKVSEALGALETAKLAANRRRNYVKHLVFCVGGFIRHAGDIPVNQITVEHVESWLLSRGSNPWSRQTYIARLSTFFEFARRRRWITENPCFFLERVSVDHRCPEVLSLDDARKLVEVITKRFPKALAWLALALFAGVRPEEAGKLHWEDINATLRRVTVRPEISKVRRQRIVTPHDAFWRLIAIAKDHGGLLPIASSTRRRYQRRIREVMGWKAWPKDILRHTCASMWLAVLPNPPTVSRQLGNSVQILLKHYDALAMPETAEKFWNI